LSGYRWLWVAWGGIFLVLEFTALIRRRDQDTLSEFVWWACKTSPGSTIATWTALHFFVAGFMIWLLIHLVFGYFR